MRNIFFGGLELGVMALVAFSLLSNPPLWKKGEAVASAPSVYAMSQQR